MAAEGNNLFNLSFLALQQIANLISSNVDKVVNQAEARMLKKMNRMIVNNVLNDSEKSQKFQRRWNKSSISIEFQTFNFFNIDIFSNVFIEFFSTFSSRSSSGFDLFNDDNERRQSFHHYNSTDFGFFDPNYNEKFIHTDEIVKHFEKNTFFRNVHFFVNKTKNMIVSKKKQFICDNLWFSFWKIVFNWWISKISLNEKKLIKTMLKADQLVIWFILLFSRFKQFVFITQKTLQKQRYTLKNATAKREFWKYSTKIFWLSKNANYIFSFFQMNEIYNGLDYQLKKLIWSFEKQIFTLKAFLQELNLIKHFWWEKKTKAYISHNIQTFERKKDLNNKQYLIKKNDFGFFTIWNRSNNTVNFSNNFFKFYFQNQNFANYSYSSNRETFQNQGQASFDQNQFSNANQQ